VASHVTVYGPVELGDPAVITHGGAGSWRLEVERLNEVLEAVRRAAEQGLKASSDGVMRALVEAIASLEDSGVLNAGLGSTLTFDGRIEMDAGLMLDDYTAGAVAIVTYPRNPIRLAEYIALNLDHVIIAGQAADMLAQKLGLPRHPGPTPRARERWEKLRKELKEGKGPRWARKILELYGDTVGAVVLVNGRLGAGTSTGGVSLKHPGRVGDSPIPGAGFYVERNVGGCAATGIGETIILGRPCIYAVKLLREGVPVDEAARAAVERHTRIFGADNLGVILLDIHGNAAAAVNTEGMPIGLAGSKLRESRAVMVRREGGA
jgi:beta-aspartyl-peptidase (threonine type)